MNQPLHGRVLATAITALLATHAPAGVAEGIEEVTVTARRTSENLQEVPVAVSAFGAEALANLQADRIDGIAGAVPNLTLVQGRGSSSNANVFIRGIG
ncbi:MAG: TonB-dependent receptor plug domain-containing protein, partial [Gammaproteobacteria bacterium]